jgi:hypothetical protein
MPHGRGLVKMEDVASEAHCRRGFGDGAATPALGRTESSHHSIQHNAVNLMVLAPPANDYRSMAGDDVLRRRRGNGEEAALQCII